MFCYRVKLTKPHERIIGKNMIKIKHKTYFSNLKRRIHTIRHLHAIAISFSILITVIVIYFLNENIGFDKNPSFLLVIIYMGCFGVSIALFLFTIKKNISRTV